MFFGQLHKRAHMWFRVSLDWGGGVTRWPCKIIMWLKKTNKKKSIRSTAVYLSNYFWIPQLWVVCIKRSYLPDRSLYTNVFAQRAPGHNPSYWLVFNVKHFQELLSFIDSSFNCNKQTNKSKVEVITIDCFCYKCRLMSMIWLTKRTSCRPFLPSSVFLAQSLCATRLYLFVLRNSML